MSDLIYILTILANWDKCIDHIFHVWSFARPDAVMIRRCKIAIEKVIVKGKLRGRQLQVRRNIKASQGQGALFLTLFLYR